MKNIKTKSTKKINKKGVLLPFLAIGLIAIAGIIPYLYESAENSSKIMRSYDEMNKKTWAAESVVNYFLKTVSDKGLGYSTSLLPKENASFSFYYGNDSSAITGTITQYNSFLNKNMYAVVKVETNNSDISFADISYTWIKPTAVSINESTFVLDRYGTLFKYKRDQGNWTWYQLSDNYIYVGGKKEVKSDKFWQIASDKGGNPVVLTTSQKAYPLKFVNSSKYNKGDEVENVYSIGRARDDSTDFNFAYITKSGNKPKLNIIDNGTTIYPKDIHDDGELTEFTFGYNHGLFLVPNDSKDSSKGYKLFGLGDNSKKQIKYSGDSNYSERIEIDTPLINNYPGIMAGSIAKIEGVQPYILNYINFIYCGKENVTSSARDIWNQVTCDNEHHKGADDKSCTCGLCLDIWNLHKQNIPLTTTIEIIATQTFTNLQFILDRNVFDGKTIGNNSRLYSKCKFYKLDNTGNKINPPEGYCCYGAKLQEKSNCILPFYMLNFNPSEVSYNQLKYFDDLTKSNDDSKGVATNTIAVGTYTIELEYSINNGSTYYSFPDNAFFWGINPQKVPDASLTANITSNRDKADDTEVASEYAFKQDEVYGQIFRFNDYMLNFRSGLTSHDYDRYDNATPTYYAVSAGNNCSLAVVSRTSDIPSEKNKPPEDFYIIGWGDNTYNQLGLRTASTTPQMTTILPLKSEIVNKYRDMKCGKYHTLFLTNEGKVYSWGGKNAKARPHLVEGLNKLTKEKKTKIVCISANEKSAGNENNIPSSAIDDEGNIYIWYDNNYDKNNESNPIIIEGGKDFSLKN